MPSIATLIHALNTHQTTSVELVQNSLALHHQFIDKNSIAVLSPKALQIAAQRDHERRQGQLRSPLHGIPIVIKDNIMYNDGTPTTANSYALHDFYPPFNADLVNQLIDQGAIILGKANLSEFAYFMGDDKTPSGYGSMYGQVKHPFDESIDPLGSSTGSAVAVKLGIVPASIGTETNGSLMAPAYQCQIVSLKPTFGLVSQHGIIPLSPTQDTAGPMGTTVLDCAILMDALLQKSPSTESHFKDSFYQTTTQPLSNARVGFISFNQYPYSELEKEIIEKSKHKIQSLGFDILELTLDYPPLDNEPTLLMEFKYAMNQFLQSVKGETKQTSLADIIKFNKAHSERCLRYGQQILEKSNQTSGDLSDSTYRKQRHQLLKEASLFETLLQQHQLVAIGTPVWLSFAPIFGNPSICLPEGLYKDKPMGIVFVGKKYDDQTLLRFAHHYENITQIN